MNLSTSRCVFCHMNSRLRLWGLTLCSICRDQLYDFAWVSLVQLLVWLFGGINGFMFIVEEVLLFFVLIFIKHRISPPWEQDQH